MSHLYYFWIGQVPTISLMSASTKTRRSFVVAAGLLTGAIAVPSHLIAQPASTDLLAFLRIYDDAWASHDPHAVAMLHSEDVLVVNRFGSMLEGRAELEQAMQFLHGPGGPFHTITFACYSEERVRAICGTETAPSIEALILAAHRPYRREAVQGSVRKCPVEGLHQLSVSS